jgi:hypothetical protein
MKFFTMNPTHEIEKEEAQPMLQAIRNKLIESGYKCRKFTGSNDGFIARHGKNFARVWFDVRCSGKAWITWRFYCDPSDPLHQQGIDCMIESVIVNFGVTSR